MAAKDLLVGGINDKLLGADAEVAVLVEPDSKWTPVCHQEPLSDVKLAVIQQQWLL